MDKETKGSNITEDFIVDDSELEMIREFLLFVRHRERGVFTAEITTHKSTRYVRMQFTEQKKIDLNPIKTIGLKG